MALTGNFSGLALLRANLAKTSIALADAAKAAAPDLGYEVSKQFSNSTDPYGTGWKRTKRGNKPLIRTGALVSSMTAVASGPTIHIGPSTGYGSFHQTGTKHIPARPIVPFAGLPPKWVRILDRAVQDAIKRQLGAR